jgi:uncharacterized protein with ParB-like and HNH nuclease domain
MEKPNRSTYTPLDFSSWNDDKSLVVAPKFQRRGVWTTPAKSFLIDTLIRQLPVPPIYIRVRQSDDRKRMVREIVDGQQRVSSILSYLANGFALSNSLDSPFAGKKFDRLPKNVQDTILQYPFICEVLQGVSDQEILEVFSRLNQYSVPLNAQELRNGRFFGFFKRTAYSLAYEHVEMWKKFKLFTDQGMARMLEVEFTSELLIAQIAGLQDKKKSIDNYYEDLDDAFPQREQCMERFRFTLDVISNLLGTLIPQSAFKRLPIFYSLYAAVYHRIYGLPNASPKTPAKRLNESERDSLQAAVTDLAHALESADEDPENVMPSLARFVIACNRQTDNIEPRKIRFETIYKRAFPGS